MSQTLVAKELKRFQSVVQNNAELRKLFGSDMKEYDTLTVEQKLYIIQAYDKGGIQQVKSMIDGDEYTYTEDAPESQAISKV